jgi:hypothetical protein
VRYSEAAAILRDRKGGKYVLSGPERFLKESFVRLSRSFGG